MRCRPWVAVVVGVGAAALTGCGDGPKLYPVRGVVRAGGQPAAHATVFLHRAGRAALTEQIPYGVAGEDGTFVVTSGPDGEGAPPGEYVLTVVWPDRSKPEDSNGMRPDALNGAYSKPAQSKLTATVRPEANTLPPIELPAPKPGGARPAAPASKAEKALKGDK